MREHRLDRSQRVEATPERTFAFYADARNLEAITPPWLRFRLVEVEPGELRPGTEIAYRLKLHGVPIRWRSRIEEWEPGRRFVDVQVSGPYRLWHHTHEFEPDRRGGTLIRDLVRYALPLGPLGAVAHSLFVRRDLERIFDFRRAAALEHLAS